MINLLPSPKQYEVVSESYHTIAFGIHTSVAAWADIVKGFCESFEKVNEEELTVCDQAGIELVLDTAIAENTYVLDSTGEQLVIRAGAREGVLYGLASALQLMDCKNGELRVQALKITDYPEKEFRAFMIDVGFCWQPFDKMLKYIDLCFMYKINHLHMHIADNVCYSLPSKAFPKLTSKKHFTYEQIAEMNRYAEARGIKLVPEFECPGHAQSLTRAYPEVFMNHAEGEQGKFFNELGDPIDPSGLVCAGSEIAFEGVKTLLAEIAELFPNAPYIHIGGDEAPCEMWNQCRDCRAYMEKHGIQSAHELYSEYVGRVASYVLTLGKTPMVWEGFPKESSHYVPKETVVIAWESHYQLCTDLLENGFKIVNASWQPTYLVDSLSKRWGPEDLLNWNVYNWQHWWPNSVAYLNPITIQPTDDLLGATMCSWGLTYEQHISRLLENFPAFAERTWTVERKFDYAKYKEIFRKVLRKAAWLVQDK